MRHMESEAPIWQLALASVGWAVLTFVLVGLLGVGLPILLAFVLIPAFPGLAGLIAAGVSIALTVATVALLGRETQRRVADRPRLRRALMSGFGFALLVTVPMLIIWFGYWVIIGSVIDPSL
jgi:hypothetical protein